jgi:HK97 family phage major capsid protein
MYSFDQELDAAILGEVAVGTDVDEVLRTGDKLSAEYKVQASTKLSELAISRMSAADFGKYMARLARRVQFALVSAILQNGSTAANGTAKNSIRGILNNFGTNGIGDATGHIGAIAYASKAAADTAITAAGGVASTDAYDLCLKVKAFLLPDNIQDAEEEDYVFVMSRSTCGAVSTVLDANGRAKARTSVDPATGKVTKSIDNTRVILVPAAAVPAGRVYLVPLKFYKLMLYGPIMNLNDGGVVQLREGLYSFVSRTWADGSMEYGHKYRPTTDITAGTTVPDNANQNAFRVFNIV